MKKLMHKLIFALLTLLIVLSVRTTAKAEEVTVSKGNVYEVAQKTELKQENSDSAKTICMLEAGTTVVVTDEQAGEWCKISADGKEGFVKVQSLKAIGNVDALNEEFKGMKADYENFYEEILELQRQQKITRIWGTVIVVLVVAIFAVGILSAHKKNKEEKGKNE